MRICVVGCGAIGSLLAARLARLPEAEVWAFDVAEDLVRAVNGGGIRVTGGAAFEVSGVSATADGGQLPPCQFGIVATKSLSTGPALAATAGAFADAAVCSVQNGIGNEEVIAGHVDRVIRGTTLLAGHLTAPGVVNLDAEGHTTLGPFEPCPASAGEIAELAGLLARAGLPASALPDARPAQWAKLIFNSATSPVTALTGLAMGQLGSGAPVRPLVDGLVAEGRAVAGALGIELDGDPVAMIDSEVVHAAGHRTSMLQDVTARRPTEIAVLNGGIVRLAREAGVPTPLHEAMVALIQATEHSWGRAP
jgi:2-dehydropantoate 2-reductase